MRQDDRPSLCPAGAAVGRSTVFAVGLQPTPSGFGTPSSWLSQCHPTKTGHDSAMQLLKASINPTGQPRRGMKAVQERTWCRAPHAGEQANATAFSILVVRNPYERLLSGFLGQVAAPWPGALPARDRAKINLPFGPGGRARSGYGEFSPTRESFAEFVRLLVGRVNSSSSRNASSDDGKHGFALEHLLPISASSIFSKCSEAVLPAGAVPAGSTLAERLARFHRVLKVERQREWYASWALDTGLARYANASHWPGGCFWRAEGQSCAESLERGPTAARAQLRACKPASKTGDPTMGRTSTGTHNKGACNLLGKFYTAELAALVSDYAEADLSAFVYPRWTPSAETPLPMPGPPLNGSTAGSACVCGLGTKGF